MCTDLLFLSSSVLGYGVLSLVRDSRIPMQLPGPAILALSKGVTKTVQVLSRGIEAVTLLTRIILK